MGRPFSATFFGALTLFYAILYFSKGPQLLSEAGSRLGLPMPVWGVVSISLGILLLVAGIGLFTGDNWARVTFLWWVGITFSANLISFFFLGYNHGPAHLLEVMTPGRVIVATLVFVLQMAGMYTMSGPRAMQYFHGSPAH